MLPVATYNLRHTLLARSPGALFVPIRSMPFLAICDAGEIVFVDHEHKALAVMPWQRFHPQARKALAQPEPFAVVFYREEGAEILSRKQAEFPRSLAAPASKKRPEEPARVLKFERKRTLD